MSQFQNLVNHSIGVGLNPDLVQASGGNTSWKSNNKIWVKGSGKRLKDAGTEEIFAFINVETLPEREIIESIDFLPYTINSISPSIEANFHILIKGNFVTHLHSLGSISMGVSSECPNTNMFEEILRFVPYFRPGPELANAIKQTESYSEKILVLRNHGVIFSGETCDDIERKIQVFEDLAREYFMRIPPSSRFPDWIEILTSGVLTPDEAVFLGAKPFAKSECILENSIGINSVGELLFPRGFSEDRVELGRFYQRVAKLIEKKTFVTYLPVEEIDYLLNWDREKLRIGMLK
jgi:rhamnose utilization protein RhaD (predicted bifunctional aldolase and dehydrogenase)